MTSEQAIDRLALLTKHAFEYPERARCEAEAVVCELLKSLGKQDVVDAWLVLQKEVDFYSGSLIDIR